MDHALLLADFCNVRNIQGRKCVQLILEIPMEEAWKAMDILGWPDASSPKKVCIALLNEDEK